MDATGFSTVVCLNYLIFLLIDYALIQLYTLLCDEL